MRWALQILPALAVQQSGVQYYAIASFKYFNIYSALHRAFACWLFIMTLPPAIIFCPLRV